MYQKGVTHVQCYCFSHQTYYFSDGGLCCLLRCSCSKPPILNQKRLNSRILMMDLLVRTSFAARISFNHTKNDSTKLELIIE